MIVWRCSREIQLGDPPMSNYIPHYTKKRQVLARKEQALRRLILRGSTREKLIAAAEEVRASRMRMLKAERATIPPKGSPEFERMAAIDEKIQALSVTPVETILAEFGVAFLKTEI